MVGMLASSKAGHDKDSLYVIIREEKEYVYLADGCVRTVEAPKRKNKKHIQIIKEKVLQDAQTGFQNLEIKKILKDYRKNLDREDG